MRVIMLKRSSCDAFRNFTYAKRTKLRVVKGKQQNEIVRIRMMTLINWYIDGIIPWSNVDLEYSSNCGPSIRKFDSNTDILSGLHWPMDTESATFSTNVISSSTAMKKANEKLLHTNIQIQSWIHTRLQFVCRRCQMTLSVCIRFEWSWSFQIFQWSISLRHRFFFYVLRVCMYIR